MSKLSLLVFLIFLSVVALFAAFNKETTTIAVPFGNTYEVPKISLLLFSASLGAATVFLIFLIRDARRFVTTYQYQKKRRKDDRINEMYGRAMNAILANDAIEARKSLGDILKEEPLHIDALLRLGDLALKEDSLETAFEYYRKALSASPKNLETRFSLAKTLEAMGRHQDALAYIEEILELDPDNLTALYEKRSMLEKTEKNNKWEELVDVQKTILKNVYTEKDKQKEELNLLGYRYEQAREALEQGQFERASKEFRAIIKADKDFIPAYLGLAEVMLREGDADGAADFLERSYEQTSSEILLARLEDLLINLGEPSRLIKIYQAAVARAQQPATKNMLRFFLGKLFYRLEMIDDAFETLRAVDTDAYPELYLLLGELYLRRQQCENAVAEFKKTIGLKRALRLPYCCADCGAMSEEWSGRCPSCNHWNTYQFNLYGTCKVR